MAALTKFSSTSMMQMMLSALLCLSVIVWPGQTYAAPRDCTGNADCPQDSEVCYWQYEGCDKGQCECNPSTHTRNYQGKCVKIRAAGDRCNANDECTSTGSGMACKNGVCACAHGALTEGFCLQEYHRLLGMECRPKVDSCVQRAGYRYTDNNIGCDVDSVTCRCNPGYKEDGVSCIHYSIGEYGCLTSEHCQGGAICLAGSCACPGGYRSTAYNTKCARNGATHNVPVGMWCDEVNQRRYCGPGLACHRCAGNEQHTCVKVYPLEAVVKAGTSGALQSGASHPKLALLVLVLATVFWTIVAGQSPCGGAIR